MTLLIERRKQARAPLEDSPMRTMFVKAILEANLSNREIARRSGLDRQTVGNLLNGKREGKIETWEIMLQAAGIEVGYRHRSVA